MDEYISRETAVDAGYLSDWYISSVGDEPPVWTEAHIDELLNDFIVIPKNTKVADVQPESRWISVEDKLPIEQGPVLCYARSTTGEGNCRILGTLRNGEFWFLQVDGTQLSFPCLNLKVTHWMPLPDPPVDGGNEDENT